MGKRIWKEIVSGYRIIAYWFPPVVYLAWANRYRLAVDPDPTPFLWWLHKIVALVGPISFFLALICTFRAEDDFNREE